MNISVLKIFLSIVCNILLMTNNLLVNGYNCLYYTSNQIRSVHCRLSELDDVPQDLDATIEEITFENCTIKQMNENSFVKYINLTMIAIRKTKYLNHVNPIHKDVFRELKKLNFLSIENIFTEFEASFSLPPNLTRISFSENDFLEDVNLTSGHSLRDFYAADCSLRSFPQFSKLAPLTTVDVRWNPMDSWTAENLAPFCLLRNLSIEWGDKARLTEPERFCQCSRLENWIKTYNITTRYSLNCTPPENTREKNNCSTIFSKDILQQRRECLDRYAAATTKSPPVDEPEEKKKKQQQQQKSWDFVIAASFFAIPVSAIGYLQLKQQNRNVRRRRQAPATPAAESHRDTRNPRKTKSTTRGPEKSERGGEAEPKSRKEEKEKEEKERAKKAQEEHHHHDEDEEEEEEEEDEDEDEESYYD